jgi:hypothetical protein
MSIYHANVMDEHNISMTFHLSNDELFVHAPLQVTCN